MKTILLAGMIGIWAAGAMAHSPLNRTTPANGVTIAQAPAEITLDFKGKIRLTRLRMNHGDTQSVDLDLTAQSGFISEYVVPMPPQGAGVYVIEWRGLGADGHALKGAFTFTVD
jgi:methionine-rich copper-binding protein CopC